ncbi:hypothetical protein Pcac1_g17867 [Phytophthora cactorum]|nr:hypothetical protein Pcac1_g17867 [Phytophthora cactorum]
MDRRQWPPPSPFQPQVSLEAMSVGANFAKAKSSIAHQRSIAVLHADIACMTPLGIFLGMVLSDSLRGQQRADYGGLA